MAFSILFLSGTSKLVFASENKWVVYNATYFSSDNSERIVNPYYGSSSGNHTVSGSFKQNVSFVYTSNVLSGLVNGSTYDFELSVKNIVPIASVNATSASILSFSPCYIWVRLADDSWICVGQYEENKTYNFSLPCSKDNVRLQLCLGTSSTQFSSDKVFNTSVSYSWTGSDYQFYVTYLLRLNGSLKYKLHVDKTVQEEIRDEIKKGNELQKEQNETSKGILGKITEFFGSFFENLKGLFVPEDGYFSDFFNRLNDFFADKLGMLYAPIDMFIKFLNTIKDASSTDSGITFPELAWDGTVIIPETKFSFSTITKDFPGLQEKIYFVTDVILVGAVLWLLQVKLKEVLEN